MIIKINVLVVKNSFLTKTAHAETRYETQHTSQHLRKTNKYIKSLKCLLASTCFVFLFNSTNLELAAWWKRRSTESRSTGSRSTESRSTESRSTESRSTESRSTESRSTESRRSTEYGVCL